MATEIKRIPTGVGGFDRLVEGGLPANSISLVTGTPGTAKTIFGLEFLANGAMNGDRGVYITLEERADCLIRQMNRLGYDMDKLVKAGKIKIIEMDTSHQGGDPYSHLTDPAFISEISEFKPDRIVLDSINLVVDLSSPEGGHRRAVGDLARIFKDLGATTLFVHERAHSKLENIEYSIEEFVCDGIILLSLHMTEYVLQRFLTVIKMRETNQSTGVYPFMIDSNGIAIRDMKNI